MNIKDQMILEEYRESKELFTNLGTTVHDILKKMVTEEKIIPMALEHRVKEEQSLAGKLDLKGEKYHSLDDITDILGARVICFYSDEVYKVAHRIEKFFVVDRANSCDKRTLLKEDSFGYLSLHYVCSLPKGQGYPEAMCEKRFEIQLRTGLQHIWAAINHETTYKSEFDVPREIKRCLSRLAGLMELADEEFINVRDRMEHYTEETREKIINNKADDIQINMISLKEYMQLNKEMRHFLWQLAAIEGSEIRDVSPESYLPQLKWLGLQNLGDVQGLLADDRDLAYALAEAALKGTELDILASTVGLRFLCRAELLRRGCSVEQVTEFFLLSYDGKARAEQQAKHLLATYKKLHG